MEFFTPIQSFLELGGPVVTILLCLSVIALAISGLKIITFLNCRVGRHSNAREALRLWHIGLKSSAVEIVQSSSSAVDKALVIGMNGITSGKKFREDLEDEIGSSAMQNLHELRRGLRALEAIAQIAPLLGLFGTVLGMIDAFQKLQAAGNSVDPSILAGGIWVALLTTAAGLAVAMPVSIILTYFETRVEDETVAIKTLTSDLFSSNTSQQNLAPKDEVAGLELGHAN